jgi:hypothetical protein
MYEDGKYCNTLYFPRGRHKSGGMYCRLKPGHTGDHWCEHEDEYEPETDS